MAPADKAAAAKLAAIRDASPWLSLREAAAYEHRPPRWLRNEATAGRVRCCRIGGRGQGMFRREWLDQHLEDLATPIVVPVRRRA